jgi:hypothetical protein
MNNLGKFIELVKSFNLQSVGTVIRSDILSIFTSVKPYRSTVLNSITMTHWQNTGRTVCLTGQSHHGTSGCLFENHIFQVDDNFNQEKDSMAVGVLSPIVSSSCMEHFNKLAFDTAQHEPLLSLS